MQETIVFEAFTLADKYSLIVSSTVLLIVNIAVFVTLKTMNKSPRLQLKDKNMGYYWLLVIMFISICSFFLVAMPCLNEKTLKTEDVLWNVFVDNKHNLIKAQPTEETYYPKYENGNLSWYTVSLEDESYRHVEKIVNTYVSEPESLIIYETEEGKLFSIHEATRPNEYRGNEVFSFWFTFIIVIYNIVIAIMLYPLFSLYQKQIQLIWNIQNEVSTVLVAVFISSVLIF